MYRVPSHANVHCCRADYAARVYAYAIENGITGGGDYRGYDRAALSFVDKNIGHGGERYYTAVVNYLSYGVGERNTIPFC